MKPAELRTILFDDSAVVTEQNSPLLNNTVPYWRPCPRRPGQAGLVTRIQTWVEAMSPANGVRGG